MIVHKKKQIIKPCWCRTRTCRGAIWTFSVPDHYTLIMKGCIVKEIDHLKCVWDFFLTHTHSTIVILFKYCCFTVLSALKLVSKKQSRCLCYWRWVIISTSPQHWLKKSRWLGTFCSVMIWICFLTVYFLSNKILHITTLPTFRLHGFLLPHMAFCTATSISL